MTSSVFRSDLIRAATAHQQNHYELCSDWHSYDSNFLEYLRNYIAYGLFGPPKSVFGHNENTDEDANLDMSTFCYNEKQREVIDLLYNKVIEYSNYEKTKTEVLCSTIYNVIFIEEEALKAQQKRYAELALVAPGNPESAERPESQKSQLQFFPIPVFKVKRNNHTKVGKNGKASEVPEKVYFIDNSGRVYNGFTDYLKNNTLPVCTMVVPKDGIYQMDPKSYNGEFSKVTNVWVEILPSPANSLGNTMLMGGDIASTILTFAGMAVGITAMATPIGAGVAMAGAVTAGVSSLWTAGRSTQHLIDRGQHGESIVDRGAIGAWIGVAGGTMGMAATGGAAILSRAIRTGTAISRAGTMVYDAVQIGNLIVNGVGVGYNTYNMYATWDETGKISKTDTIVLTMHLFFFCNSVVNLRLAQTLIKTSQSQVLKDYEASLRSKRHQREFQRMARNTRAAGTNDVSSNEEIIRAINRIENKDDFFQAMVRNRKAFSASGAKATFANDKVVVNSQLTIDPIEFSNLPKEVRADIIRGVSSVSNGNAPTGTSNVPSIDPLNVGKINNAAGSKTKTSTKATPKTSTEAKPKTSTEAKPKTSTEAKPKTSTEAKPKTSTEAKPKTSTGTDQKVSIGNDQKNTNVKSNNVAGTETENAAASLRNVPTAPKAYTRPNETSYKNVDTSNGTILREFCTKHASDMIQTAQPQISDFQNVLKDLRNVQNCAAIFFKLLEIAHKIYVQIAQDRKITMGEILGRIADYLWDIVKTYLIQARPGCVVDDPQVAKIINLLVEELATQVAEKVSDWVAGFKKWLEEEYPQMIRL